ncbi:NACHT domain-containing protein [Streptomyces sp. NPDC003660]
MRGDWHTARARRRLGFAACGAALAALAAVLRFWWLDAAVAGVLISAIGAFVSVVALVADILRGDGDPPLRSAAEDRCRAADALAEAVRDQWVAEARSRRLRDPLPIEVGWVPADRRLADHPENIRRAQPLPAPRDAVVEHVPDSAALPSGRRLVVLGGPGSGKSVLALRFVLGRLAVRPSGGPVPVIVPLAGWDPWRTGLRDWLAERLAADYPPLSAPDGQRTLARALLDSGLVMPVLDGFDELARPGWAEAVRRVNAELDDDLPLLLTSRKEAWATAVAEGDVLTAAEVVELRPLDLAQAGSHLERTARPRPTADGGRATVWTPVLRELAERPGSAPARALTTPLMVSLARAVYGDTSGDPSELLDTGRFPTVASVEEHLLGAFVPAAFAGCGPRATSDAERRLTVLARALQHRDTGRLAWWELESMLPTALRVYTPGLLALAVQALLVLPVMVARGLSGQARTADVVSVGATLFGQTLGFAFGAACLLPRDGGLPSRRFILRQTLLTALVSGLLWAAFACTDDLRFGFRYGTLTDGWMPDLLGGCLFSLLFTLFFGIAGLPRRPVPLSLPWSGAAGRAVARVLGATVLLGGAGSAGSVLLDSSRDPWTALIGITCMAAGTALLVSGTHRQDGQHPGRAGRIGQRFAAGAVRGTAAALLIGITACTAAGVAAVGVTVLKSGGAEDLAGRRIDGWRFAVRDGVRTAVTSRPLSGRMLIPGDGARPIAYPGDGEPPDCTIPLLKDRTCRPFTSRRTVFESREGVVVVRLALTAGTGGADGPATVAYPANLRSVLPAPARGWLTEGPATGLLMRCLPPFVASGVLIGLVGGCVCGVYRALSVPSDIMRATGPGSSLRTDRTASFTRAGVVALLVALVCVPVMVLPGDWGGLSHVGTRLWLPLGAAALALSAWGRFAVARVWLAATGRLPWRLMAFLEDAHRRGVLRRSGACFEFRHLRLQSHLAGGAAGVRDQGGPVDGAWERAPLRGVPGRGSGQ